MIRSHVSLQDHDVERLADLSNQITQPRTDFSSQDRLAVLWDEDEVVVALVDSVRPVAVLLRLLHFIPKYRKPPEGFA